MTTFTHPLKVKALNRDGMTTQVVIQQQATVTNLTSGASSIRIPARAQIFDMSMIVNVSGSGNSQGVACRIGTSTDAVFFGQLIGSVQSTIYRAGVARNLATVSAANWKIGANDVQLHLDVSGVTTAAGAVDNFEGVFTVYYIVNENNP